ncbi:MAG: urease accessory protein UreD [Solirubrobacteraceae bacterium]
MTADVSVRAELVGGRTVIASLSGVEPWQPRILSEAGASGVGWARVALVQSRASLIASDDIALSVVVEKGAALELVELGALVAYHARGGRGALLRARVSVGPRGRLVWLGQPLVVGEGSDVSSTISIELDEGALMLRGESVVLGRAGERSGSLVSRTRVSLAGMPVLDETLDTGCVSLHSPVVAGDATMIAAVTLAGVRDLEPPEGAMQAFGCATAWRSAGGSVEVGAAAASVAERWRGLCQLEPALSCGFAFPSPVGAGSSSRSS